jgi:hypothetical protein
MPIKVLLDTDIDIVGDIDDAICLAYLLAQPAYDLLGITTVSWATDKRAMVASVRMRDFQIPGLCAKTSRFWWMVAWAIQQHHGERRRILHLSRSARLVRAEPPCEGACKTSRKRQPNHDVALQTNLR